MSIKTYHLLPGGGLWTIGRCLGALEHQPVRQIERRSQPIGNAAVVV